MDVVNVLSNPQPGRDAQVSNAAVGSESLYVRLPDDSRSESS